MYISRTGTILPASPCRAELFEIWHTRSVTDVITCAKFFVNRFRGYRGQTPQNCHIPLICCVALTTVYALPCNTDSIGSTRLQYGRRRQLLMRFSLVISDVWLKWLMWNQFYPFSQRGAQKISPFKNYAIAAIVTSIAYTGTVTTITRNFPNFYPLHYIGLLLLCNVSYEQEHNTI